MPLHGRDEPFRVEPLGDRGQARRDAAEELRSRQRAEALELPLERTAEENGIGVGRLRDQFQPERRRLALEALAGESGEAAGSGRDGGARAGPQGCDRAADRDEVAARGRRNR